jgi:hypothetical protein
VAFLVTSDLQGWAREHVPGVDIRQETEKFRDHTFRTAITDWPGAWRNWMRRASESLGQVAGKAPPASFRERDQQVARDRVAAFTGGLAAAPEPDQRRTQPGEVIDMETPNAPRRLG